MRKMKKINGFLVVRFNDREKRIYPELGSFGVIDAEQYAGDIDIDLGEMEYTDAETIEIAVEQARGLDAEQDYSDEPPVCTVTVETAEEVKVEEVNPQLLIKGWEEQLKTQVESKRNPDIDPRTAAHELNGYKAALCDLGLIDQEDRAVTPDHFAPGMAEQPLPKDSEELLAHICDQVCKHSDQAESQGKLDAKCAECVVGRLMGEAEERENHIVANAKERLDGLIRELSETQSNTKAQHLEREARAYLEALCTMRTLTRVEAAIYDQAITQGVLGRPEPPALETFKNIYLGVKDDPTVKKVYALGLVLAQECPDNDCRIYLNTFNMAREIDDALDMVGGNTAPSLVLRRELMERAGELWQMYEKNPAVQQFKEGMMS